MSFIIQEILQLINIKVDDQMVGGGWYASSTIFDCLDEIKEK